jgi:hypothetical protein
MEMGTVPCLLQMVCESVLFEIPVARDVHSHAPTWQLFGWKPDCSVATWVAVVTGG